MKEFQQRYEPYAVLSLVCGILGVIIPGALSFAAIIFGVLSSYKYIDHVHKGRWMSVAGILLGVAYVFVWFVYYTH